MDQTYSWQESAERFRNLADELFLKPILELESLDRYLKERVERSFILPGTEFLAFAYLHRTFAELTNGALRPPVICRLPLMDKLEGGGFHVGILRSYVNALEARDKHLPKRERTEISYLTDTVINLAKDDEELGGRRPIVSIVMLGASQPNLKGKKPKEKNVPINYLGQIGQKVLAESAHFGPGMPAWVHASFGYNMGNCFVSTAQRRFNNTSFLSHMLRFG